MPQFAQDNAPLYILVGSNVVMELETGTGPSGFQNWRQNLYANYEESSKKFALCKLKFEFHASPYEVDAVSGLPYQNIFS